MQSPPTPVTKPRGPLLAWWTSVSREVRSYKVLSLFAVKIDDSVLSQTLSSYHLGVYQFYKVIMSKSLSTDLIA